MSRVPAEISPAPRSREASPENRVPAPAPELGFMLDISRGRVPTMPFLFRIVDLLETLGYGQLQLYTEHTFAFAAHEDVWRDASPTTPEEIRALDARCRSRGIELVPNLNSFGHVERWLKHEKYKPLAECPDGFFHEVFKTFRAAGTFAAGEASADFMAELYREFLPNFSSKKFNIGGDEPWELGQGRSRELCEKFGRRAVYVEHMLRLKNRAEACGKKIMFWADVLLDGSGEIPAALLDGAVPVIWGYEADHPFGEQCARVKAALENCRAPNGGFYLAPGTSAWLSFGTRQTNAFANIRAACSAAKKHGAAGVLLTTWGDFGYHNPFAANLLPLIFCAELARGDSAAEPSPELFAPALERIGVPAAGRFAEALFAFGKLDDFIAKKIVNRSWIREIFFASDEAFPRLAQGVPAEEISAAEAEALRVLRLLDGVPAESSAAEELRVAAEMTLAALRRAAAFVAGSAVAGSGPAANARARREALKEKFAAAWRKNFREGGLAESLAYF